MEIGETILLTKFNLEVVGIDVEDAKEYFVLCLPS